MAETTRSADDAPIASDLSGRELGDYRLLRRLGRGAMAEVYLAEQRSLRRQVALKILPSSLASDETYVRRFHREAQAAAALVHANIVQIHEVGCASGVHFIAQEYVRGLNLHELLVRKGIPDVPLVLSIMRQVAAALHKAGEQGIVHRDIKPENILLTPGGEVKVADFGLARVSGDDAGLNLTQVGLTMGTPLYMSPEQVEGKPLDPRSDIYSFGVTCYHVLTGQPPFRGDTALSIAVQHLKSLPERLEILRPELPPALCRVVHKMLAKLPNDRYATVRDLLVDLRALAPAEFDHALPQEIDLEETSNSTLHDHRSATEQLAVLMKTSAGTPAWRWKWQWIAVGVLSAFFVGLVSANLARQQPLLPPVSPTEQLVERRASAESQYLYAAMIDTEEAWKSVFQYFPESKEFSLRAQQQLARWYMKHDDYAHALNVFADLSAQAEASAEFRAFGLGGEAMVLALQGKNEPSARKLADLWPLRQELDPQMRALMRQVLRKNRQALGTGAALKWDQWLEPSLPPGRGRFGG